jgi:hypothetical protein
MNRVLGVVVAALVGVVVLSYSGPSSYPVPIEQEEQAFITLLNQYRVDNGLQPLTVDHRLSVASEWKSEDMGENAYFSHTDSLGRSPFVMMCEEALYCYNAYKGENIAAGFQTGAAVFEGWRASPGHDANMLNPNYITTGIGLVKTPGSPFTYYWTSTFGSIFCQPDFNNDLKVNALDLGGYADRMNISVEDPGYKPVYDFNRNGVINTLDLVPFVQVFNTSC